jgi:hypothetical protein
MSGKVSSPAGNVITFEVVQDATLHDDNGVPSVDATANVLVRDVVGQKTDAAVTAVGTTKSLMAYLKGCLSWLTVASADATANAAAKDVIGNKSDAAVTSVGTTKSLVAYLKGILATLRNGTGGTGPGTNASIYDALGYDGVAAIPGTAGMLRTKAGSAFIIQSTVTSADIPNNTQTGAAITGACSGSVMVEEIVLETDGTGLAGPTNIRLSTDNANGLTGKANPLLSQAVSGLGANKTIQSATATLHKLPFLLESGKKLYVDGDDAAGTGAGTCRVSIRCRRVGDGDSLAAVNL